MKIYDLSKQLEEVGNINRLTVDSDLIQAINQIEDVPAFINYTMQHHSDARHTHSILLTFPSLLIRLSQEDWKKIILDNCPRSTEFKENPFRYIHENGMYADIIFLIRYLSIDVLDLTNRIDMAFADRRACADYVNTYRETLLLSEKELSEDLFDFYSISLDELRSYTNSLVQQGLKKLG